MTIGIDVRGLNFHTFTGVGNYTLALIDNLPKEYKYVFIGGDKETNELLKNRYQHAFDFRIISINDYFGVPGYITNKHITILSLTSLLPITSKRVRYFDFLILPQPKPITIHPDTTLISVIHDTFGVMNPEFMSYRQRVVENKTLYQRLITQSTTLVVNSYATGYDLTRYFECPEEKISLIYPGDISHELAPDTVRIGKPYFVAVSGIEPRKNWLNIIKGFKEFSKHHPEYSLKLLGKISNQQYYKKVLQEIHNHPNILLQIDVTDQEKIDTISSATGLLYPSIYEGFGFPILEAHKYGVPVITSHVSSMAEIAGDGGVFVNPFVHGQICAAMRMIVEDKEYAQKISNYATENYSRFTWGQFANNWKILLS